MVGYPKWYRGKKGKQQSERGKHPTFAAATGGDGLDQYNPHVASETRSVEPNLTFKSPANGSY